MSKYNPKRLLKKIPGKAKRVVALVLCVSMVASLITFILPTRAADNTGTIGLKDLIREADKNTMDSYIQASLGGYVYKVDGVTKPTVSNNFGSRYAGEVWADLSVFARDQEVRAGIPSNLNNDGDFVNNTLWLGEHTDGIDATVEMMDYSDFLNVFSVLGSSQMLNDNVILPIDVVFVLDTSSTMNDSSTNFRLYKALQAVNSAFDTVLTNENNRVAFVTYDTNAEVYLPLGRYAPIADEKDSTNNNSGIYFIGYEGSDNYNKSYSKSVGISNTDPVARLRDQQVRYTNTEYYRYRYSQNAQINAISTTAEADNTGLIPSNRLMTAAAVFVNYESDTPPYENGTGNLSVINAGLGRVDSATEFHFTVTLSDTTINGQRGDMTFTNGVATFTLKSGERKTATGLPAGITYEVTEEEENRPENTAGNEVGYFTTVTGGKGTISANSTSSAAYVNYGYIEDLDKSTLGPTLRFDKTSTVHSDTSYGGVELVDVKGNLTVINTVLGGADKDFQFTVTLSDTTINDKRGDMTFTNGVATFTLKNNESMTAEGLPAGTTYTVTQTDANQDGYTTQQHYREFTEWFSIHSGTNVHQGLYEGLKLLFEESETTAVVDTVFGLQEVPRIPVVVMLSDGAPSYATTADSNAKRDGRDRPNYVEGGSGNAGIPEYVGEITKWWAPENQLYQNHDTISRHNLVGTPTYGGWGLTLPVYLMAAHMKQKVNEHYFGSTSPTDYPGTQIITVGVDSEATTVTHEVELMRTLLNPSERLWATYIQAHKSDPREDGLDYTSNILKAVQTYLDESSDLTQLKLQVDNDGYWTTIERAPDDGTVYPITEENIRYNDAYYDVESDDLAAELQSIVSRLRFGGTVFSPYTGTNAAGVGDSLTYANPIGDYMTVDGVTDLTMFGEHYEVGKRAVYDYKVNQEIIKQGHTQADPSLIQEGWYSETVDPDTGKTVYEHHDEIPDDTTGWDIGWTFRVTYQTASQFVRTWTGSESGLTEKEQNTTYTFYTVIVPEGESSERVNLSYDIQRDAYYLVKNSQGEIVGTVEGGIYRSKDNKVIKVINGAVVLDPDDEQSVIGIIQGTGTGGTIQPGDPANHWSADGGVGDELGKVDASGQYVMDGNDIVGIIEDLNARTDPVTFDLLDDIRIWFEDTGTYRESVETDFLIETGFSKALYVDIKVNALPVQVARIDLNPETFVPIRYKSNLNDPAASTPLRVYYDVSLDPAYLRYATPGDAEKQDKSKAVGVAMADISAPYSKANTGYYFFNEEDGFYDEVVADADGVYRDKNETPLKKDDLERYTAFYTNFFTNNSYDGYPVTIDTFDKSRGNTAVTFAASTDNQFYRFQKNRVLFLIPGTYGLDDRPAEIELGNLSEGVWIGNKDTNNAGKVFYADENPGDSYHACDPTDFEDLLAVLNDARATSGAEGTPSPYWWFGDCIPVDGGDNVDNYENTLKARKSEVESESWYTSDLEEEIDTRFTDFQKALNGLAYQPQISPDNWYYIIREYYLPHFDEASEGGTTENVELCYMAIARKGSEFGTGLGRNMGEMIEWYHPAEFTEDEIKNGKDVGGNTRPFKDQTEEDPHYGYPNGEEDMEETDGGGHRHTGGWYVSAKPGGLRVGGMSNFVGTKGYDIRTDETKIEDSVANANRTERARTYFLPAVSSYTGSDSDAVIINLYLGNNGRILTPQTLLLVTKLAYDANGDLDLNEEFTFDVYIKGFTGTHSAVKVTWEPEAERWRRTIGAIQANTNNAGLLFGTEFSDQLARVNRNGVAYTDPETENVDEFPYYVYIPDVPDFPGVSGDTDTFRTVYYTADVNEEPDVGVRNTHDDKDDPYIEFRATAWLIPVEAYDSEIEAGRTWTFTEDESRYTKITAGPEGENGAEAKGLVIATMKPNTELGENTANVELDSDFSISAEYLTESYYFFQYDESTGMGTAGKLEDGVFTQGITLKSGEGRLFNTIANKAEFIVTEKLTEAQVNAGWKFQSANGWMTNGQIDDDAFYIDIDRRYTYPFDDANYTYTVSGTTGNDEAVAHYINIQELKGLTIRKVLEAEENTTVNEKDRERDFTITITLTDDQGNPLTGLLDYTLYKPDGNVTGHLVQGSHTHEPPDDADTDYEDPLKDIVANPVGTWTVTLKDGWYINITGLPKGAGYTVTEEPATGYEPEPVEGTVGGNGPYNPDDGGEADPYVQQGAMPDEDDASVGVKFVNVKQPPDPVTIDLLVTKTVDDEDGNGYPGTEFTFTLTGVSAVGSNGEAITPIPMPEDSEVTITMPGDGEVSFEGIKFTVPGTYIYYVKEVQSNPTVPGITYDTTTRIVTVVVKEEYDTNGDYTGKLTAEVTVVNAETGRSTELTGRIENPEPGPGEGYHIVFEFDDDNNFVNTYNPASITITLEGVKIFENGTLRGGMFDFELTGIPNEDGELPPAPGGPDAEWDRIRGNGMAIGSGENEDEKPEDTEDEETGETEDEETGETEDEETGETENEETGETEKAENTPENEPDTGTDVVYSSWDSVVRYANEVVMPLADEEAEEGKTVPDSVKIKNNGIGEIIAKITFKEPGTYVYKIREVIPEDPSNIIYDLSVYTVTVEVMQDKSGALYAQMTITVNGEDETVDEIKFVNVVTVGNLTVTKTVSGNDADYNKMFHFTVALSNTGINGTFGDMTFVNGVAEITLKHGESKTATGLPAGIKYTVTEAEANQDGYTTTSTGATGTIPEGGTATAVFTNSKSITTPEDDDDEGNLIIRKTVAGSEGDRDQEFTFTVTLSSRITGTYGGIRFENGVATVKLKHGESVRATGLPAGITYTVTEAEANQDGYTTSSTGSSGRIPANGTARAEFVNDKDSPPSEAPPPEETTSPPEESTPPPEETTPPPSETLPPDIPQTGDESQLGLWLTLLGLSMAGLFASLFYTVRKSKPKDKDQK